MSQASSSTDFPPISYNTLASLSPLTHGVRKFDTNSGKFKKMHPLEKAAFLSHSTMNHPKEMINVLARDILMYPTPFQYNKQIKSYEIILDKQSHYVDLTASEFLPLFRDDFMEVKKSGKSMIAITVNLKGVVFADTLQRGLKLHNCIVSPPIPSIVVADDDGNDGDDVYYSQFLSNLCVGFPAPVLPSMEKYLLALFNRKNATPKVDGTGYILDTVVDFLNFSFRHRLPVLFPYLVTLLASNNTWLVSQNLCPLAELNPDIMRLIFVQQNLLLARQKMLVPKTLEEIKKGDYFAKRPKLERETYGLGVSGKDISEEALWIPMLTQFVVEPRESIAPIDGDFFFVLAKKLSLALEESETVEFYCANFKQPSEISDNESDD